MPETATIPPFPAPRDGAPDVLFVTGEHSGSDHAARLLNGLRARRPGIRAAALGGPALAAAGAQTLFDTTRFSAVGLVEVLANLGYYRLLFRRTLEWIREHRPRVVVPVDYPGFNLRLADRLRREGLSRKGGGTIAVCQYIGPQIWAWKAGRRFKMARDLDALGVIFPFEVDCYADTALPVRFVGHPFVAPDSPPPPVRHEPGAPVLLLPGSRPKPVRKIFPVLLAAWREYLRAAETDVAAAGSGGVKKLPREAVVLHTGEPVLDELRRALERFADIAPTVRLLARGEAPVPVAASAALMSSGTVSLSVALAGIPGAIAYRANPLTWLIGRRLVKGVEYLGIANILLKRPAWPEFLQDAARPQTLAARLRECISDPAAATLAHTDAAELHSMLGGGMDDIGDAAGWLCEWV
ncbi:MAG: lipid-A-disaccharide synthase [Puniceicoccales bacterium]|jgi:lipid-A-disaccharide synthase|nr:lipid-A-disaccharide synthase [Puniceicoccales bacterium]